MHTPSFSEHVYENDSVTIRYTYKDGKTFSSDQVVSAEWRSDKIETLTINNGIRLDEDGNGNTVFIVEIGQLDTPPGMIHGQLLVDIGNGLIVVSDDYLSVSERLSL